ncbi:jg16443 [Pararge aegeria aegeria]|uniref:Jg16443 protein n=1 Tax=Pararge aegeria aegeria TaxID=348720 RepID=A0A8S4SJK0_9NEOP|nr:jg16443 [Pararge aegeria aegeria]
MADTLKIRNSVPAKKCLAGHFAINTPKGMQGTTLRSKPTTPFTPEHSIATMLLAAELSMAIVPSYFPYEFCHKMLY